MNLSVLIVLSALIFSVSCRWIQIDDNGYEINNNLVADFPRDFHRSWKRTWKSCECGDGSGKTGVWWVFGGCVKGSRWKDCHGNHNAGQCCLQGNY